MDGVDAEGLGGEIGDSDRCGVGFGQLAFVYR
jgi:hypothetical protein